MSWLGNLFGWTQADRKEDAALAEMRARQKLIELQQKEAKEAGK